MSVETDTMPVWRVRCDGLLGCTATLPGRHDDPGVFTSIREVDIALEIAGWVTVDQPGAPLHFCRDCAGGHRLQPATAAAFVGANG